MHQTPSPTEFPGADRVSDRRSIGNIASTVPDKSVPGYAIR